MERDGSKRRKNALMNESRRELGQPGGVVSASDSRSGGQGFDSRPCHVASNCLKKPKLSPVHPPVKWVPSYRLHMYWSAGTSVALLCGDTVTLSNEDF
ncbi:hypothetical protein ElyMa_004805800 [Elysia marginata]|uniref:Uncharacterized protein n=1 Tax=Elysia marginata TaxID=1093978 RepID=A0AAV4IM06_9GAST|nr:hypothetical protein ElyMa_004805800 [Elysia marginata]